MAAFGSANYDAHAYETNRLIYPPTLYDTIYEYHSLCGGGQWDLCVDLGCGTGQATRAVAHRFSKVVGVDLSRPMIENARRFTDGTEVAHKVQYVESPVEDLPFLKDGTVDLVTASEAAHWFNYDTLWPELARVLKPGGTVAFWNYSEAKLPKHPTLNHMIIEFIDDVPLRDYWQGPSHMIDRSLLDAMPLPSTGFDLASLKRIKYTGDYLDRESAPDPKPILLKRHLSWDKLAQFLRTLSAYHKYQDAHPEDKDEDGRDLADRFVAKLRERVLADGGVDDAVDIDTLLGLIMFTKVR